MEELQWRANAAELTARENAIVDIGAWTARGEQDKLGAAFKAGFDAGLTLNEAKELVGQLSRLRIRIRVNDKSHPLSDELSACWSLPIF